MAPRLNKVYVARFFERDNKRPFHSDKVVAHNWDAAHDIAWEWGENKYHRRLVKVEIERSKGEVIVG